MCEQVSACNGGDQTSKVWPEKQSGACIPSGDPQTQCPNRFPYKRIPYFICMVVDSCPGGLVTCEWWEMENLGGYPEGGLFDCTSTADVCPG